VDTTNVTARRAGVVYFAFMIVAIVGEFLFPSFVVSGDPAATAARIADAELTYRVGVLLGFLTHVIFLVLVVLLYRLFRDVDQAQALLMVVFVSVGVAVAFANLLVRFAPLVLGGGAEYLSAFSKPQLDALALASLSFRGNGNAIPMLFWGLWLFPFGILVIKSGFLPRILGVLLLVAGVGYLASGVTFVLLPEYRTAVFRWMTPLYLGEVPIIFWLLVKGAAWKRAAASD